MLFDYNNTSSPSIYNMGKRLKVTPHQLPVIKVPQCEKDPLGEVELLNLPSLDNMGSLLENAGGFLQQDRMISDKRRTLDRVLKSSYHGAKIQIVDDTKHYDALINPNKNKADYDEKIVSVGYESEIKPGDIFRWCNTETYWIVYLQDLTELAYFRGNIRRCSYEIAWKDEKGNLKKTYAAVRGPVETQINFIQKHQISVDEPNHSLNILLPRNKDTLRYFRRYSKFYLRGTDEGSPEVCWRVEATDWISTPGILEITAEEYYINREEDDVEEGIAGGLIIRPVEPSPQDIIYGENLIEPRVSYTYIYNGTEESEWSVNSNDVQVEVDGNQAVVKWKKNIGGEFTLSYGENSKVIKVNSLF